MSRSLSATVLAVLALAPVALAETIGVVGVYSDPACTTATTPAPGALNIALTLGSCSLITGFSAYGLITRSGSFYSLTAYSDATCTTKLTSFTNVAVGACSSMDSAPLGLYVKLSNSVTVKNVWAGDKTCSVAATAQASVKTIPVGEVGGSGICTSMTLAAYTGSILAKETATGITFAGFAAVNCPSYAQVLTWTSANYNNCTASDTTLSSAYFYISTGAKNDVVADSTTAATYSPLAIGLGIGLGLGIPVVAVVWWIFSKKAAAIAKAATTIRSPDSTAV